jgi:hypothetical protein
MNRPQRHPFPDWEVRPRYAPEKGITNVWVNIYIGPVSMCPDATRETVQELRALADDIEVLLNEKDVHDSTPEDLAVPAAAEIARDRNSPEEDAAMDLLEATQKEAGAQGVTSED